MELELYNINNDDQRESVYAGTGTVDTTSNDKAKYEFAVPRGVFTAVDERISNGPWNVRATIVATRRVGGRLQHAKLYCAESEDGTTDELYFELSSMRAPSEGATALRWKDQLAMRSDTHQVPDFSVCWVRHTGPIAGRRANATSTVRVSFLWNGHDLDDMLLADACLALEHYPDWK